MEFGAYPHRLKPRRTLLFVGVVLAGVLTVGAIGSIARGRHTSRRGASVATSLRDDFSLLRRPLRPSDHLPARLAGIVADGALLPPAPSQPKPVMLGIEPKQARRAVLRRFGISAWLIPGTGGLCWYAEDHRRILGGECIKAPIRRDALLASDGLLYDRGFTIGLVTDRVRSITQTVRGAAKRPVPLVSGFFVAKYGAQLLAVTAHGTRILVPIRGLPSPS